jgi:hypothetical protein
MSQHNNPTDFSTLHISADPLADFQAKMDELIAQANAQLQHPNIDTINQPGHHQVPDEFLLPQQADNTKYLLVSVRGINYKDLLVLRAEVADK